MTPEAITLLFREAHEAFPPLEVKPSDDNLTTIRETLLPILMEIPYDQLGGAHSLTGILATQGGTPPTMVVVHSFARAAYRSTIKIFPTMRRPSSESAGKQPTAPDSMTMPATKRPSAAQPNF